jgi:hypothetical protein
MRFHVVPEKEEQILDFFLAFALIAGLEKGVEPSEEFLVLFVDVVVSG